MYIFFNIYKIKGIKELNIKKLKELICIKMYLIFL